MKERNYGRSFGVRLAEVLPWSLHCEPQTARPSGRDDSTRQKQRAARLRRRPLHAGLQVIGERLGIQSPLRNTVITRQKLAGKVVRNAGADLELGSIRPQGCEAAARPLVKRDVGSIERVVGSTPFRPCGARGTLDKFRKT